MLAALALLFLLSTYVLPDQPPIHGRCVGVADGDTIRVLSGDNQQIRVRFAFIDAPEKGQPFGQRAKQAMSELVFGKDVKLRPHAVDRYCALRSNRPLARSRSNSALGVEKRRKGTFA